MSGAGARTRRVELVAAALAVIYIGYLAAAPGPERLVSGIDNGAQLVVPAAAAALAARVARREAGRLRSSWALIALACGSWAVGQAIWSWYEIVREVEVPSPSLADAGYLAAVPLLLAGLVRYPAAGLLTMGRLRVVLDATAIGLGLLFTAHGVFLGAVLEMGDLSTPGRLVAITYPVADVIALAVVGAILLRRDDGGQGPLPLLLAALAGLTIADSGFAYLTSVGELGNAPVNAGWTVGFGLIGLAARRVPGEGSDRPVARMPLAAEALVPVFPLALAAAVLATRVLRDDPVGPFLGVTGAALLLCVAIRQVAIQSENVELTANLRSLVGELREREDEMHYRAFHDPLTGLANRDLFRNRLDHALSRRRRPGVVTVLFIDLDDFKTVNDSLGHDAGDRLLVLVAERLRANIRPGDTVARLGGDEFAILIDDHDPGDLAQRILQSFDVPFTVGSRELHARASVGVASGSPEVVTAERLLQDADLAMYAAKADGKGRSTAFEPTMREGAIERLDLLHDLDVALERGELLLLYQPVHRFGPGPGGAPLELAGYEALLRWEHPVRGVLLPVTFLELAEESGRMEAIGWWILEQACRAQLRFPVGVDGVAPAVSVNLSARQLLAPSAPQVVAHALAVSGVDPDRVVIELTESTLLAGAGVAERLDELRALGVRLAVDDFGTGYSSLAYLARLPMDIVKIDRSFVDRMADDGEEVLIGAVVHLAKGLGLRTVAEGVEHPWQLRRLHELGCDAVQGYLLGLPGPLPEAAERPHHHGA